VRQDRFSQSLDMLDGGPQDSAAEDVALTLAQQYAYVFPDDAALAALVALGPLVEIGAGTGYWAHKLRSIGADIVAFDLAPLNGERANRYHPPAPLWAHVEQGDQTALTEHADRSLFLCWPPLFSSLGDCLTHYTGDTVAYIGDGGYRTARIDHLNETFTKVAQAPVRALDPHPCAPPRLTIWKRIARLVIHWLVPRAPDKAATRLRLRAKRWASRNKLRMDHVSESRLPSSHLDVPRGDVFVLDRCN
jgi:hypothetical protein